MSGDRKSINQKSLTVRQRSLDNVEKLEESLAITNRLDALNQDFDVSQRQVAYSSLIQEQNIS